MLDEPKDESDKVDGNSYRSMQWELADCLQRIYEAGEEIARLDALCKSLQAKSGRRTTTRRKSKKGKKR